MVSYWQDFDTTTGPANPDSINLNWQIERGYAYDFASIRLSQMVLVCLIDFGVITLQASTTNSQEEHNVT